MVGCLKRKARSQMISCDSSATAARMHKIVNDFNHSSVVESAPHTIATDFSDSSAIASATHTMANHIGHASAIASAMHTIVNNASNSSDVAHAGFDLQWFQSSLGRRKRKTHDDSDFVLLAGAGPIHKIANYCNFPSEVASALRTIAEDLDDYLEVAGETRTIANGINHPSAVQCARLVTTNDSRNPSPSRRKFARLQRCLLFLLHSRAQYTWSLAIANILSLPRTQYKLWQNIALETSAMHTI